MKDRDDYFQAFMEGPGAYFFSNGYEGELKETFIAGWNAAAQWLVGTEFHAVYVVCDGPPGHESGRFVETETEDGKGIGLKPDGGWEEHPNGNGMWRLGPFLAPKKIHGHV